MIGNQKQAGTERHRSTHRTNIKTNKNKKKKT